MRRPPPLPPAPGAPKAGADGSTADDRAHARPQATADPSAPATPATPVADPSGPERSTAPVIPITAPIGLSPQRPHDLGAASDPEIEAAAPGAAAPVRLREVWGAARARRKALRAEVRRFTVRQRRRRAVWLGAAASVVVLIAVTLGAAYSPLFGVERISVVGTAKLDAEAVEAALAEQLGTPLPLVDESAVKAALVAFPLVESYTLEARPPHELVVRIVERTPIGYLETRAGFALVDAAGVTLATARAAGSDAPILSIAGGSGSEAFEAAGLVMRALPATIRTQVTAVSATTSDDVTLTLGASGATVVWGSPEESAMKAVVLATAMKARPPAGVSEYDVSSPSAVVVR